LIEFKRTGYEIKALICWSLVLILASFDAWAQGTPCTSEVETAPLPASAVNSSSACVVLTSGQWPGQISPPVTVYPFTDAPANTSYGDPDNNVESLYGSYGNTEPQSHSNQGITLAGNIKPLCTDGSLPGANNICANNNLPAAIVFVFMGFSNCELETCGGGSDIWSGQDPNQLAGQPCAGQCPNPEDIGIVPYTPPWNEANDGITQKSLLWQIYNNNPGNPLVGPHVAVFNGAFGGRVDITWDTVSGWYVNHTCPFTGYTGDRYCNYQGVKQELQANGYSEKQVQAIFFKSANSDPDCDLMGKYFCGSGHIKDAYQAEVYLGNIMRYLHCGPLNSDGTCTSTINPRYPNLQQVFLTSRIYGGWADGNNVTQSGTTYYIGCTSPEPFSYEEGFAVQRLIVAQINGTADNYSGNVDSNHAPWIDWGPYLWARNDQVRSDGLVWCDNNSNPSVCIGQQDFRYGDVNNFNTYWGDLTHPTYKGLQKVANLLVNFIGGNPNVTGSPFVTPWIKQ
jgi:hypothetical protein